MVTRAALADDATNVDGTIDMMVRIAGSEVDATKVEEWIRQHVR